MTSRLLLIEFIWWLITAVVVTVVMYPIWRDFPAFRFNAVNIGYIVAFVTFTRVAFLLKYTFLAQAQYAKIGFVLLTFAIVLGFATQIQSFNVWIDNGDPEVLLAATTASKRESLLNYIRSEFLFFAIGAIISAFLLSGRLLVSVWRLRNRGKA